VAGWLPGRGRCGEMMVDHDHHAPGLVRRGRLAPDSGFLQKTAQAGDFFHVHLIVAGALEEGPLGADHKGELVVSVRLDLADLPIRSTREVQVRLRGSLPSTRL